jgi:hypothetical protein
MNPRERDDEMLREYLEGDSALSRLYRREAREQPDARLDARIRARARDAVAGNSPVAHSPFARHWMVPTSLAAVFVLSVSVVLLMPEPAMEPDGEINGEAGGADKSAADTAIVSDAPAGAADVEQPPARMSAPAAASRQAAKRREQASVGDDSGRDATFAPGDLAPGAQQRAQEAEEKPGEEGKKVARQAKGGSGGGAPPAALESAGQPAPHPLPVPTGAVQNDPQAWLRFIEVLLEDQNRDAAQGNLRAFRGRYPDFPLPATLVPLAASLNAQ